MIHTNPSEMIENTRNEPHGLSISKQTYSKVKKEILKNKIEKIKNKNIIVKIFLIIEKFEPKVINNATANQNGVHLLFNDLSYETYVQLEKFISRYERKRQLEISEMQTSDDFHFSADATMSEHCDYNNSKLKYSNKEKMLIRRCEYEAIQTIN